MVKTEDQDEDEGVSASVGALRDGTVDPQPDTAHAGVKAEEDGQPSSSSSYSKFIGMGFPPTLVDKMLQKHGDKDFNAILESLLFHSSLTKSGSESSSSLGSLFDSDSEENISHLGSMKEPHEEIKPEPDSFSERRSYLLSAMNFSQQEVDRAFNQLGEEAPLDQLVDTIVTAQVAGFAGGNENVDATTEGKAESLFGVMEKTLHLLQMGFTEEEVSGAIDSSGQEATVQELADSIFARRIDNSIKQTEVKIESDFLGGTENQHSTCHQRLRYYDDEDDKIGVKRAKSIFTDNSSGASSSRPGNQPSLTPWLSGCTGSVSNGYVKEEFDAMASGPRPDVRPEIAKPPYFLYGNVVDIPKGTWHQLSDFLFNVEPEFLNSQYFSAVMRREGYLHNLPMETRHIVVPKSPMTIEDALPFTRQWWPSWDTRKHIGVVTLDVAEIEQMCEKLGKIMTDSRGVLSHEKQAHIMQQCKMSNLIWIGKDRLSPLEPHQLEHILGYPRNHTEQFELNTPDRLAAMKYTFQTDVLAYLLSVLKPKYPNGLRLLSIYSGLGGAEVALDRLGIPIKCIVSVEESDVNRKILRKWWRRTNQAGELRQFVGIWKLKTIVLEDLVKEFGGFDLIIGGNYSSCRGGRTINATMGMDSNKFYEYARVVKIVRALHNS